MSSYLPAGVTDREIEYEYSAPYGRDDVAQCDGCHEEFLSAEVHAVDCYTMCRDCVDVCDVCGEFMDNAMFPDLVIKIRFRRWEMNGALSKPHCPKCAADWVLGTFLDCPRTFDSEDFPGEWGKDAIAQLLAQAFPLPKKEVACAA